MVGDWRILRGNQENIEKMKNNSLQNEKYLL